MALDPHEEFKPPQYLVGRQERGGTSSAGVFWSVLMVTALQK